MTSQLVLACRGEPVTHTPVWFMRQAGRSLPEYRKLRAGMSMLATCQQPDLVTEITLQPVRRHRVDAAIFFSDIVLPLAAIGVDIDIKAGVGPVIARPIRDEAGLVQLRPLTPDDISYITQAAQAVVAELGDIPLIGFAGAPFTLASYLVEGGPSRTHGRTKALMHSNPTLWHDLCARLAQLSLAFLQVQVNAGAAVVQLFDSWAGCLSEADYREYVFPHSQSIFTALSEQNPVVPTIHFGVDTGHLLTAMSEAGADVMGVDWRTPLPVAAGLVGNRPLQGNLDPALLLAPESVVAREVRRVMTEARGLPGHIFNLGHGVLPETDPDLLTRVVELVHEFSA